MAFSDHFSKQADAYTRFRPQYPRELFGYLASLAPGHELAWDCATGNGQAAGGLVEFFDRVAATDASPQQIAAAARHERVDYAVCLAEASPLADHSVDLVTVAQALHWFDRPKFYAEVCRVARERGVLAVWSYGLTRITPQIDAVVEHLYGPILGPYWPAERRIVEEGYATIEFPFREAAPPAFAMTARWNFDELFGYLGTWSSAVRYAERQGSDPLELVRGELLAAWGDEQQTRSVEWPLRLRVGYVN